MDTVSTAWFPVEPGDFPLDASLLLRTVVNYQSYLVAVTQGRVVEGQVELGLLGIECLQQVVDHFRTADPDRALHFVEIGAGPGLGRDMARAFSRVPDGGAIVFLCRSAATCEAALGLLNVRRPLPGSMLRH